MAFQIHRIERKKLDKLLKQTIIEYQAFYRLKLNRKINLFLVEDRETIDLLKGKKTEDWFVGWASRDSIFLLNNDNYEKESKHKYSEEKYFSLLKHELAHCFTYILIESFKRPIWLAEGVSIFLSGQNKFRKTPERFEIFIDVYDKLDNRVYNEAGFAVEFLVKNYGKSKLLKLLKKSKESKSKKDFGRIFKEIYGFELKYSNFYLKK